MPIPMTCVGVDPGRGHQPADRDTEGVEIVVRVLERPVRAQDDVLVGRGQSLVDHAVAVLMDLDPDFPAIGDIDEHGARGFGAEIDADGEAGRAHGSACRDVVGPGSTTTFRPSRVASVAKAIGAWSSGYRCVISGPRSIWPEAVRAIARGRSLACIRRQRRSESSLRRAMPAGNVVRSSSGMPTSTTRPPGRTATIASDSAASSPATSNATSTVSSRAIHADDGPMRRAHRPGSRDTVREQVRGDDRPGTRATQELDDQEPERPTAIDADPVTRHDRAEIECVKGDAERLEEGGLRVPDGVRHPMQEPLRPGHDRAKRAVCRAVSREPRGEAGVGASREARLAVATRIGRIGRDAFAGSRAIDDHARELVTQDERRPERRVADARPAIPVQVGPAQADRADTDEHLARAGLGDRFARQSDVARAVESGDLGECHCACRGHLDGCP